MNNNTCIIFAVEGNRLLMYIWRVSDRTCSPLNEYQKVPTHLPQFACNCRGGSATLPGVPKVLSGVPTCSQTYYNHSHRTPVLIIRYASYTKGRPEYPPRVRYSPEIDASKFTLHILSDTPGGYQWLKYIVLMSNCTRVDVSDLLTTRTANLWMVALHPDPDPTWQSGTVANTSPGKSQFNSFYKLRLRNL